MEQLLGTGASGAVFAARDLNTQTPVALKLLRPELAEDVGLRARFRREAGVLQHLSHPAIAVNLAACIQCTRCVRACRDEQVNDVIGLAFRGDHAQIVFDMDDPMGASTCVACGECVQACPTGALSPKTHIGSQKVDRKVDSVCPFCGVGCLITYNVRDEKIISVEGRDGPANHGRLCVKGRFGFDYAHHPDRLTVPLIRKPGVPKEVQPYGADWRAVFREASWDEALDLVAEKFNAAEARYGSEAVWPYQYAGTMGLVMRDGIHRLRHAKKYSGFHSTICVNPAWTGFVAGTGLLAGPDPREMAKSDCVVIWGTNAVNTQVNVMTHAMRARKERGADTAGEVPSAVTAALGAIQIPDDAKHRGPSSPLTDAEIDANLAKLSAANADAAAKVGLAKTVLGLFGLG